MKPLLLAAFLALSGALVAAQTPALPTPTPAPAATPAPSVAAVLAAAQAHTSDIGFTYNIPADWEVVDMKPSLPAVQEQQKQEATSEEEKKGIDCIQIALTARHGDPATVVIAVALPFACFGQQMTDKDLPGFAQGAAEGLTRSFDLSDSVVGSYALGSHSLWIERSKGTVKGHPETAYTVETVCSILKKGAACWMAMAADKQALEIFEKGAVTLDGEVQPALVPANAFAKKPF